MRLSFCHVITLSSRLFPRSFISLCVCGTGGGRKSTLSDKSRAINSNLAQGNFSPPPVLCAYSIVAGWEKAGWDRSREEGREREDHKKRNGEIA